MSLQNNNNQKYENNSDGFDISGGTTARKLTISGGDVAIAGTGTAVITFPTVTSTLLYSGGDLGTPSAGVLTSATGLPISTGVSGLATGIATFLATPSSANLASALTDETGTGKAVFATKPTFIGTIQTIVAVSALALDGSAGNMFTKTISTASTFTQSNFSTGQNFTLKVTGAYTITWFSTITWITSGGTAPTQGAITTYGFTCTGSNTFDGYLIATQ